MAVIHTNIRSNLEIYTFGHQVQLAKKYLEQVDNTITLTHNKNLMENVQFPKINRTQSWKSAVLPTKPTKTTRGSLYRSRLSTVAKPLIHLPILPQIHYQQICKQKAVHNGTDEPAEPVFEGLIVQQINRPIQVPNLQFNQKKALPPIKRRKSNCRLAKEQTNHDNAKPDVKWNDNCKCMRCRLIKNDYEVGVSGQYNHWGQYPCVPDAVINREEDESSDEETKN